MSCSILQQNAHSIRARSRSAGRAASQEAEMPRSEGRGLQLLSAALHFHHLPPQAPQNITESPPRLPPCPCPLLTRTFPPLHPTGPRSHGRCSGASLGGTCLLLLPTRHLWPLPGWVPPGVTPCPLGMFPRSRGGTAVGAQGGRQGAGVGMGLSQAQHTAQGISCLCSHVLNPAEP